MTRRLALALTVVAPLLLAVTASEAQDKPKIRIGTHISISAHTFMQRKPEILKNLGKTYEVEWVRFAGSGDAMPALIAGKLDACLGTPFPLSTALFQAKVPVTIVHQLLSFGFDGHYDDAGIVRADSGINQVADLKGKIVGVNAIGGTVDMGVRIIARKHGLNAEKDITVVEARPPQLPGMVRDGKIHAASVFQPFYEDAMAKGDVKVLWTTSEIYGGPTDYVFMVFENKFLKASPKAVRDYVEDYLRAVSWALDNRAEAVRLYADHWKLPVPVVDSYLLSKKDYLVRRDGKVAAPAIQRIVDALATNGFIGERYDVAKYIDLSYLPQ
jgi:ABC-type nitrate/sulfonate/bicarbonate transport system substrate-binding protein